MRLADPVPGAGRASGDGGTGDGGAGGGRAGDGGRAAHEVDRLVAAEPGVPGLRLLLDDEALRGWLADVLGAGAAAGARRTYLRWKPGAGGVARVRLGGGDVSLAVWHHDSAAKLDKTVQRGGGAVLAADRDALAVVARPAADRDLPGLGHLLSHGPEHVLRRLDAVDDAARLVLRRALTAAGSTGGDGDGDAAADGRVVTLAWKPQRRWVGLLGPVTGPQVVLRAYQRPGPAGPAAGVPARYRAVADALPGAAPRLLGVDGRRGLVVVEHLGGRSLDRLPDPDHEACSDAGRVVASLHRAASSRPAAPSVPRLGVDTECATVAAAGHQVALLLPEVGVDGLVADLVGALRRLPPAHVALLHGDLSADQVLRRPDGRTALIDLDEVTYGPASVDLASAAAAWWLTDPGRAPSRTAALLRGYARESTVPGDDELRVRTAAHLVRRAAEPFRTGAPDWPAQVAAVLRAARDVLDGRLPVAGGGA